MYIPMSVLVVVLFIWAMNTSTQDEISDFFGSLFWMAVLFGGLALVGGVIFLAIAFGVQFWEEIWNILVALGVMGAMVGLVTFVTKYPKQAFKIFGIGALVIASFNLIIYGFQNHFNVVGFVICGIILAGSIYSWIPFVKNLVKCRGIK